MPGTDGAAQHSRRARVASVYDFYLGGDHHSAADRAFAERMLASVPEAQEVALLNRAFLHRAVTYCARQGVRQFLDVGSAIPRVSPVHETAAALVADPRVVYADIDDDAVRAGRHLLEGIPGTTMVRGDVRRPEELLASPEVRSLIDPAEPVALLLLGVLHYVADDEDPAGIVARYRSALARGSFLVVSHGTDDGEPQHVKSMIDITEAGQTDAYMRSRSRIVTFLEGFRPVEPGVVFLPDWRPSPSDPPATPRARVMAYGAVGRLA
jgi:hypothetical protein